MSPQTPPEQPPILNKNANAQEMDLEDVFKLAMNNMSTANYQVAALMFQDILASVPDHFDSMYYLGLAYYNTSDIENALYMIKKAIDNQPGNVEWWSNYGVILNENGRYALAIDAFDEGEKIDPDNAILLWNKCYACFLNGAYEQAEIAGRKAVKIAPDIPEPWLNLGATLARLGNIEEAVECWDKVLEINPDYTMAYNNLGNAYRDLGDLEKSAEFCRKALEMNPNYVEALSNMGNVLIDQGNVGEAEIYYRKAIANKPDYAEAHNNLCIALAAQSRYEDSVLHGRYAISFRPDYFEAYLNLSDSLRNLGRAQEALQAVQQASVLRPDSAEVQMDMADVLLMLDQYGDAEVALNKVEALKPDNPRIFIKLASVQERAGKLEEALESINKAVKDNPQMPEAYLRRGQILHINNHVHDAMADYKKAMELLPDNAQLHVAIADLLLTMNDIKAAEDHVQKAKALNPNIPGIYFTMASLKKFTPEDEDFKKMLSLAPHIESTGLEQTATLHFALASAYDDFKAYDDAFKHYKIANDAKRKTVPLQWERSKANFAELKTRHTKQSHQDYKGLGFKTDMPVFILGMPRSGTTLTEQIISSHPDVYGAGELTIFNAIERKFGPLTPENCHDIGAYYAQQMRARDKDGTAKIITDKMPANFSRVAQILAILPDAKIIHCRRDSIDTCLSCYKQNFARGQYWSYQLDELGAYYKLYEDLMAHWRQTFPGRFLDIDYEDTVNDLETQAKKLIDHVGLKWDDACLAPHKQKRAVVTASKMQVTQPVYQSSVKAWTRYGEHLKPLIESLGRQDALDLLKTEATGSIK